MKGEENETQGTREEREEVTRENEARKRAKGEERKVKNR